MERTSVLAQSRVLLWGVRGPGKNVLPDLEKDPTCARAHIVAHSAGSQPAHNAATHMCEVCSNVARACGLVGAGSGMGSAASASGAGPVTDLIWRARLASLDCACGCLCT